MKEFNLSFAGCGFLGIYHVGVASCFSEYAPNLLVSKISGASVGSLAAVALLCDVPLGQMTTDVLSVAVKARSRALGPLHPGFDLNQIIREGLEAALPENAHEICSGRLFISVTRCLDGKNVLLSEFHSREDLIQAILCSCFIPFYSGMRMPVFNGMSLIDGGFSDNLPVLDENTITVSPFAGEHDICPQDESHNLLQINLANTSIAVSPENICRFARILFPPHPEVLSQMCQQGFDDALKFLQRKNLISCTRCMAIQSSLILAEKYPESDAEASSNSETYTEHAYDDCMDCRYRRQMALLDSLPEAVVKAIQEACDQVNKGVINWLFRHRPMKLLSIIGLPYVLPIDISILIFCKVWQKLPMLQKELQSKFHNIVTLIKTLLSKIDHSRHLYSAKFSCQLAITEFDYTEDNVTSSYAHPNQDIPAHETCKIKTEEERRRKTSIKIAELCTRKASAAERRQHRKSYAGFINTASQQLLENQRRKSMTEISQPERVIRNMKFGFTVEIAPSAQVKGDKQDVLDALRTLSEEDHELNVIELTNKAINMERERIGQGEVGPVPIDTIGQIMNVTANEAMMSYYYVDEDKTVKVTELYNVDDDETAAVLSKEDEGASKLHWMHSREDPIPIISLPDAFDDHEFDTSDVEYDLSEKDDILGVLLEKEDKNDAEEITPSTSTKPRRKNSIFSFN